MLKNLFYLFCQDLTVMFGATGFQVSYLKSDKLAQGNSRKTCFSLAFYFRIHLASHFPLIQGVVALVIRAAGSRNQPRPFGITAPQQQCLFAFSFEGDKWRSLSLFLFLSASQQGCLTLKARGIKDPGICVLKLGVLAQHFRSQAQSSQLKIPASSSQPTWEQLILG